MNFNQYTKKSLEAVQSAQSLAVEHHHQQMEQLHLLLALLQQEGGLAPQILRKLGVTVESLEAAAQAELDKLPRVSGSREADKFYISQGVDDVLQLAERLAASMKDEYVSVEHLLLALVEAAQGPVKELLGTYRISKEDCLQALQAIRGNQRVTSDSPEDTYEALELWGLDTLVKGQEGYAYNPVEQKVIKDWDEHLVVIASDAGDPYCLDLRRNDTAVFWAEHGAGTWDFQPAFDCLEDFLESVLDVPKTQEYETAYPYHYIRLIVTGISDTKKALVFLKQHFGDSSFQQTKDRLKELPLLIYSGLDTGTAPLENSLDRWGLMYEKQQISLEKFLEDQAYIRNL